VLLLLVLLQTMLLLKLVCARESQLGRGGDGWDLVQGRASWEGVEVDGIWCKGEPAGKWWWWMAWGWAWLVARPGGGCLAYSTPSRALWLTAGWAGI
jgi:hypothetical protein